jgi:NitT/TauT family transport system substrate-binding protein
MIKKHILLLLLLLPLSFISSQELKKVSFVPHWIPQAQFAGYYVALDKGIYKKHGLDLTIITGGPKVSTISNLVSGSVDFALMWLSNAIQERAGGAKIINLAQIVNRSALMLIAKKTSGINKPEDMNGRKVGIWGGDFQIQPMAFFKKCNLNVKTIMQGNSINLFFFGGIDVTSAMWYNEYHTIINSGLNPDELNTFFFSDYGLNFPEEGIYCREDYYLNNKKVCEAFVLASLEGWKYAFSHQEEALEIITKYIKKENMINNRSHQKWMLERMKDLIFPENIGNNFGRLSEESYMLVADKLFENGLIKRIPPFTELYKPLFLKR